jgi:Zn-dependent protease with chaperone function
MTPLSPDVQRILDSIYSPQRQAIAAQLSSLEITIFFASTVLQLALLFGFYYSGGATRLRDALERRLKRPLMATAAFVAIAYAGLAVVLLPLHWYSSFIVPHEYGLSLETPATWFHDWAVGDLVNLGVLLLLALPFGPAVRRFGKRWPIVAAAVAAPLIVFGSAIFPAYVAPLFNQYVPMPPSPLTESILSLAARQGIDASAVYEYDMSRQTTVGNAYVAGLGPTARIAVGDNLLKDLKPDEVLYVVAHEMGHYKLHHIWWGSLYGWLGAIAAIVFLAWAGGLAVARSAPRLARGLDDPAAIVILAALLLCFALITEPIANGLSRQIEHAADVFAASHTDLGDAGIRAFARLGSEGLSVVHPSPLVVWYFYTHPPLDERVEYAATQRSSGH